MNTVEAVKIFALGVVIALLGMLLVNQSQKTNAGDSAAAGSLIALTSQAGSGGKNTFLYVIDSETRHLAIYSGDENGMAFCGARYIGYDVFIDEAKWKRAPSGYSVEEAEKMYKESMSKKKGK